MKIINTRNVHQVLPFALQELKAEGHRRDSRNGPVLVYPTPVTTVYHQPMERVLFHPLRDANPFFHLYESLWMLAGRNDVEGVARYAKNMRNYSDDGQILHGAYGFRWKNFFGRNQLTEIIYKLRENPDDRRAVLQMWHAPEDLFTEGKDVPCNTMATFQINVNGELDLHLFCRSNDIIWGAYGANAVHFAFLLEYMAFAIGVKAGRFYQISVNWHAYLDTFAKVEELILVDGPQENPYNDVRWIPMNWGCDTIEVVNQWIERVLFSADHGFELQESYPDDQPFFEMVYHVLKAHHYYKQIGVNEALNYLQIADQRVDWVLAARQWLERRVK